MGFALLVALFLLPLVRFLRAWPMHEAAKPDQIGKSAWKALAICFLIACHATLTCSRLVELNRQAGVVLPRPYHPKGWRRSVPSERWFRLLHQIDRERPLTSEETREFHAWLDQETAAWKLFGVARGALLLYVLVPLGLVWLVGVTTSPDLPGACRLVAAALVAVLGACGVCLIRLGVFTAMRGD